LASFSDEEVREAIMSIIDQEKVVTERELKVRLERKYFPWIVGRVLDAIVNKQLKRVGYRGRRKIGGGAPRHFFTLKGTCYKDIEPIIKKKRELTAQVNCITSGGGIAGAHAENLFLEAFEKLGFKIHGRDMSEFGGKRVEGVSGKAPPNLDLVVERNGVVYGVDVKNWIKYESSEVEKIKKKVDVACKLDIVPFIIARYVDKDTIYKVIYKNRGLTYPYRELLIPSSFRSLADECKSCLGYPILAVDELPDYKVRWLEKLHVDYVTKWSKI